MAATLLNTFGHGILVTVNVWYLNNVVGLPAGNIGLALTIAGVAGVLVGIPSGGLGDRRDPRDVLVILLVAQAFAIACYVQVSSFAGLVLAASFFAATSQAANAVRQGLIAVILPAHSRVAGRAHLRVTTNVGLGLGSVIGVIGLSLNRRPVFVALILMDALLTLAATAAVRRLPSTQPTPQRASISRWPVLRDRPFAVVVGLNVLLALQYGILEVGVALWISRTSAPPAMVGSMLILNTAIVILLQVRATKGVDSVSAAAQVCRTAGALFALTCLLIAFAGVGNRTSAVVLLTLAAVVVSMGEVLQSAGEWGLSFGLAPEELQGQYQGLASSGSALSAMMAPGLLGLVVMTGQVGWVALALIFVLASLCIVPATRWASISR